MKTKRSRPSHMHVRAALVAPLLALVALAARAGAATPEIGHIYPDFPGAGPHIITGEAFEPGKTEVWTWEPPSGESRRRDAGVPPGEPLPELPSEPPQGAGRAEVLDVEPQVIVASLQGSVAWVKTAEGFSRPRLFNVARPFWVSEDRAEAGALVYVFGFGLRPEYRRSEALLGSPAGALPVRTIVEPRALRTADRRLVYFQVPADAAPGRYGVYCHNSYGGRWGWQKAGDLEVLAPHRVAGRPPADRPGVSRLPDRVPGRESSYHHRRGLRAGKDGGVDLEPEQG